MVVADNANTQEEEELLFNCRVLTPQRGVFHGPVQRVYLQGVAGDLELLPRHEPILTPLKVGAMVLTLPTEMGHAPQEVLAVHGGFLDMNGREAVVYASSAEKAGEIDLERAKEAQRRARERLDKVTLHKDDATPVDIDRAHLALMRAMLRMQVAERAAHM